ncbi:MAG: DUF58 domain-containing protein, partial [Pseudomonadota bacterium]
MSELLGTTNSLAGTAARSPKRQGLGHRLAGLWPGEALRRLIIERVRKRKDARSPPYTLVYRSVFILPTGFGVGFGILLILTGLGGLNFNNNLALLLVFVLGAIVQTTTHLTYRNLAGLDITSVRGEPVFASEPLHLKLVLDNPEDRNRYALEASLATDPSGDCKDLQAGRSATWNLELPTTRRGWLEIPPLRLQTRYPLALFRAWTWVFPAGRALVWPRPAQDPPPLPASGDGRAGKARKGSGDQVYGLRNYRSGDPLKHIAWRTSARHDQLYTRQMETPQEASCVLDYRQLEGRPIEERLSILTAWVLMAEHRQLKYTLRLPGTTMPASSGPGHRDA